MITEGAMKLEIRFAVFANRIGAMETVERLKPRPILKF
jgi:hypothetical protein